MDSEPWRTCHNWERVEQMVWHAKHTYDFPFDMKLGKAILACDVIYDAKPQRRWRSADWLFENDGQTPTNVAAARHIMREGVTDDNRMVLIYMAHYIYPRMTYDHFYKEMAESVNLYKEKPLVTAERKIEELTEIHNGLADNILVRLTPMERIAFIAIRTGVERAIMSYEESMKGAKRA